MTELRVDIQRLVLQGVPPEWIDGLGPELERAVAAAAREAVPVDAAGSVGALWARPPAFTDRAAFTAHVGRQIWSDVRGWLP